MVSQAWYGLCLDTAVETVKESFVTMVTLLQLAAQKKGFEDRIAELEELEAKGMQLPAEFLRKNEGVVCCGESCDPLQRPTSEKVLKILP